MTITTLPPGPAAGAASPSGPPTARAGAPPGFAAMLGDAAQTWTALAEGQSDNSGVSDDSQTQAQASDLAVDPAASEAAAQVAAIPTPVAISPETVGVIDAALVGQAAGAVTAPDGSTTSAASAASPLVPAPQVATPTGAAVASAPVGEPTTTAVPSAAVVPVTTTGVPTEAAAQPIMPGATVAQAATDAVPAAPAPGQPAATSGTQVDGALGQVTDAAAASIDGAPAPATASPASPATGGASGSPTDTSAGGQGQPQPDADASASTPAAPTTGAEKPAAPAAAATAPAAPSVAAAAPAAPSVVAAPVQPTVSGATPAAQAAAIEALVHLSRQRGHSTARIALAPEQLGGIQVTLLFSSNGITARLIADRPEAAAALQRAGNDLRDSLQQQGLDLTKLETGFAGDSSGRYSERSESTWTPSGGGNASKNAGADSGDLDTTLHLTLNEPVAPEQLAPGRTIDLRA